MYTKGGISGLYPGYLPRILRKATVGAITWTLFEKATGNRIHKH